MKRFMLPALFITLTLTLWCGSVHAQQRDFTLTNSTSGRIYGKCGPLAHAVEAGGSKDRQCYGQFHVAVWNDADSVLDTLESYWFGCASGQIRQITVSAVDPYSATDSCEDPQGD